MFVSAFVRRSDGGVEVIGLSEHRECLSGDSLSYAYKEAERMGLKLASTKNPVAGLHASEIHWREDED